MEAKHTVNVNVYHLYILVTSCPFPFEAAVGNLATGLFSILKQLLFAPTTQKNLLIATYIKCI